MGGKNFRFSLESVLKLREHETERARQALAEARRNRQEQQARVERANARLTELSRTGLQGAMGSGKLRQFDAFRRDAQQAYDEAREKLEHLRNQEEQARIVLMNKRAAEESLKTLRDREEASFREAQESAEAAFLDEQAIARYHRQRKTAKL